MSDVTEKKKSRRHAGRRPAASIGGIGLIIILMVSVSSFYLGSLPLVGAGMRYTAEFTEAAGLRAGNEVRIAGVRVGDVEEVALDGSKVAVTFKVNNATVGDQTQASIQIKTVLGQKYLALNPRGDRPADPDVPLTDTIAPYDVIEAFSDASRQISGDVNSNDQGLDMDQLADSMRSLSDAFSGTAGEFGPALDGISRLSETIASRDQEVQRLLAATSDTTAILADRNEEFIRLIAGAGQLLDELNGRRESISALLASTTALSNSLTGIVRDNEEQLGPALDSLRNVNELLKDQNENIRQTITYMAPFYRLFANVVGDGRWFNAILTNILPPALPAQNTTRPPGMQGQFNQGNTEEG